MKNNDQQLGSPNILFSGTTSELNALSAVQGMIAFDTTLGKQVVYDGANWIQSGGSGTTSSMTATGGTETTVDGKTVHTFLSSGTFEVLTAGTCEILVVGGGGGGGGGGAPGGGGGGGGVILLEVVLEVAEYAIVVGDGGSASGTGVNSRVGSLIAFGGGNGYSYSPGVLAGNGGCGGGGGYGDTTGGLGLSGQGYNGGNSRGDTPPHETGGGGGSGEVGENYADSIKSGNGGDGILSDISGSSFYYGGGGGGTKVIGYSISAGTGGFGGGGDGSTDGTSAGTAGTTNRGGGGGGSHNAAGGAGGSGIVIIKY